MAAPYRIQKPQPHSRARVQKGKRSVAVAVDQQLEFKFYLDRLLKMVPGEVIGLYLIGQGFIPRDQPIVLGVWGLICLAGVVALRAYGTADPVAREAPDWVHVSISSVAFVIWVYTLGEPFATWGLSVPYVGSLLVLAWTFFVPILYRGPSA